MSDISELTSLILKFRGDRNWDQHSRYKDMAISMVLETAEFAEHFQWRSDAKMEEYLKDPMNKEAVADELSDVLYWVLLASHEMNLDIKREFVRKMKKNELKYPVEKVNPR